MPEKPPSGHDEPEESPATAPRATRPARAAGRQGSAARNDEAQHRFTDDRIIDFWSFVHALLNSDTTLRRFFRLVSYLTLVTGVAAAGIILAVTVLPQAHLVINWVWPAVGVGGVANAVILRRFARALKGVAAEKARTSRGRAAERTDSDTASR